MADSYADAAEALKSARHVVAVTGAGISEESGIPTFRGNGGLWAKYPPEQFATIDAYVNNPDKVWNFWIEVGEIMLNAEPNPAHFALAHLEDAGHLQAVITQNIDNLHQLAGSKTVIEYHGNATQLSCMQCRTRHPFDRSEVTKTAPRCPACRGLMKPDVVMFGEEIPRYAMLESEVQAQRCDVLIIVGTSAQIYPAAALPFRAKERGAYVVEVNVERTDFTSSVTDTFLPGKAGDTLPRLAELVIEAE